MPIDPDTLSLLERTFTKNGLELSVKMLQSTSRRKDCVLMRRVAVRTLRANGYTLEAIGGILKRHHATILHLLKSEGWDLSPDIEIVNSEKALLSARMQYHKKQIELLRAKL